MSEHVTCPHCQSVIENDGSLSGQAVACSICSGKFIMPPVEISEVEPMDITFEMVLSDSPTNSNSSFDSLLEHMKSQPKSTWQIVGVVTLFLSLGLIGMIVNPREIQESDPDARKAFESTEDWLTRLDDKGKSDKPLTDTSTGKEWIQATSKVKLAFVKKVQPQPETFQQSLESIFPTEVVKEVNLYYSDETRLDENCRSVVRAENSRLFRQAKQADDVRTLQKALQEEPWKRQ